MDLEKLINLGKKLGYEGKELQSYCSEQQNLEREREQQNLEREEPWFDEKRDDIDVYLLRFERHAVCQKWDRALWSVHLSALLSGKALEVYSRLPSTEINDFDKLKLALLKRFALTEDGFKKKLKSSRPETGETFTQFSVRLENYAIRWIELSGTEKSYDQLLDLILRDAFIQACNRDLAMFLKERTPKSLSEMVKLADQYCEAHGGDAIGLSRSKPSKPAFSKQVSVLENSKTSEKPRDGNDGITSTEGKSSRFKIARPTCEYCNKKGHTVERCYSKHPDLRPVQNSSAASLRDSHCLFETSNLPLSKGKVGNFTVVMLRDSGCSGVVVSRRLVDASQFTNETQEFICVDSRVIRAPVARIHVDTPYYTGECDAWVIDSPSYELIIGNIPGARHPNNPNGLWQVGETHAVQTRAKKLSETRKMPPLDVPVIEGNQSPSEFINSQERDETLYNVLRLGKQGVVKSKPNGATSQFVFKNGILFRRFSSPKVRNGHVFMQVVVPKSHRSKVMAVAHESPMSGHMAAGRTKDRVREHFYWPGVDSDIIRFCRSCDICQKTFPKGKVPRAPLCNLPLIGTPFERVAVDLIGPITPKTEKGNRYILTLVDFATRYPEAIALRAIDVEPVAEALLDIFSRMGIPREILSDNGGQFTGEMMKEVHRLISVRGITTTPYHAMGNGLCERYNGTLKSMLKKVCSNKPETWDRYLSAVLFAYREVPQESTGFSPFELIYGFRVRGPTAVLKELWTKEFPDPDVQTVYQYVLDLKDRFEFSVKLAQENLTSAAKKQKKQYDRKSKLRNLKVGERVLLLLPIKSSETLDDVKFGSDLSPDQVVLAKQTLTEFTDILTDLPGKTDVVQHNIVLTTEKPIRTKQYPLPFKSQDILENEIVKMEKLVFDAEPMGDPELLFTNLAGAKYLTQIDLTKGYWQVPLHPDAKIYTAFASSKGLKHFKMMPFGLVNAGATFNRLVRQVISGLSCTMD
ncbi:uncharacterized protein LOC141915195 [Tubulanus polymorphus]|uniref:uncharacterized protein LOC141915195 n=1 Tax=Tubulanus polymorphus TaxID=672921 RepID=UPI003DA3235E